MTNANTPNYYRDLAYSSDVHTKREKAVTNRNQYRVDH